MIRSTEYLEESVCRVKKGEKTCSGWLCSDDGWILTSAHMFLEDGEVYDGNTSTPINVDIKFPKSPEVQAQLLYAEKQVAEGIDFAVLRLYRPLKGVIPLHVNIDDGTSIGRVRIMGIGKITSSTVSGADGKIESNLINIESGTLGFLHVSAEDAVQYGFSGGPVYSLDMKAVIGCQVEASRSGLASHTGILTSTLVPIAERKTVNAMLLSRMVERFPLLRDHLIILTRPFSGFDMIKLLNGYKKGNCSYFDNQYIDEAILPMVRRQEMRNTVKRDLNQPILDAVSKEQGQNYFILGEEGGSGKTITMRKLFFSWMRECVQANSVRRIPIYIELRNLLTENMGRGQAGMLFVKHLQDTFFQQGIFQNGEDLGDRLYQELLTPSYKWTGYVFLLDGLNEVPLTLRRTICEEILFWANMPHIQVVVTSRYKDDFLVEGTSYLPDSVSFEAFLEDQQPESETNFRLLVIQKLKDSVISNYLIRVGIQETVIKETMENQALLEILRIPMYLTIFARLYLVRPNRRSSIACTKGQLLGEFFDEQKKRIQTEQVTQKDKIRPKYTHQRAAELEQDIAKKLFVFDKIIPYIAFYLVNAHEQALGIKAYDLQELIISLINQTSAFQMRARLFRRASYPNNPYDEIRMFNAKSKEDEAEAVIRFIVEELHLMRSVVIKRPQASSRIESDEIDVIMYEFLHENLRDFFAAKQMRGDIQFFISMELIRFPEFMELRPRLSLAQRNIPKAVLEFLGDICMEYSFCPYWDENHKEWIVSDPNSPISKSYIAQILNTLRGKTDAVSRSIVSNTIAVMKYSRKNDLSGLDLHALDFSDTWLGGIRFSRAYGNVYLTANFDNATIHATNLLRTGYNAAVNCVCRSEHDPDCIFSADTSGRVMCWNLREKTGRELCNLGGSVRDMLLSSAINVLYLALKHAIYCLRLSEMSVFKIYETSAFIRSLQLTDSGVRFNTDINPVSWIELRPNDGQLYKLVENEDSASFWPVSFSCEGSDGTWLIAGGTSKAHRIQVFKKRMSGEWEKNPIQTVLLPYGNNVSWITLSKDETKALFCVQNCLYEYSIIDKKLGVETFRLLGGEFRFASYWYDANDVPSGILYCDGTNIVLLDKNYQEYIRLNGSNGKCKFVAPFLIKRGPYLKDCLYIFTNQSGVQRDVYEKYHLYVNSEIQEFDADTNICSRIYSVDKSVKMGYCLGDREIGLYKLNLHRLSLQSACWTEMDDMDFKFVDHKEMMGSVSFCVQRLGPQIIVYDRYTEESDSFTVYQGLLIQRCSMKNLKGTMAEPEYQDILRRYGAILEEADK